VITFSSQDVQGDGGEAFLRKLSAQVHPDEDFAPLVYFSRFKDGSVLFLNQRPEAVDLSKTHPRMVKAPLSIPDFGLAEIPGK